jgi:low temperature requirement protein LtrA
MMAGLLRTRTGHEARVGSVELFFDLVFVFAVTQLSHGLLAHPGWLGALETLILFLGVWWVWIFTSWATNWLDPERGPVRIMLFGLMGCGLLLAMSIPQAWDARGLVFAGSYAFMQVGRSFFLTMALRRHNPVNYRNFQRVTIWMAVSGLFWIAGGLAQGHDRMLFWAAALCIEYAGPFALFYVPGFGHSQTVDWDVEGAHMAERCGLFIIIALGETILVTGATMAEMRWSWPVFAVFGGAFVNTLAMWWIYFNIGAERASHLIAHHADPGRIARLAYTYLHLPIIAGIIVSAAGDEMAMAHPTGHLAGATTATNLGGAAIFLIGNLLCKRATWGHWPLSHGAGLLVLALGAVVPLHSGLEVALWSSAALLIVAIWETRSLRETPSPQPD